MFQWTHCLGHMYSLFNLLIPILSFIWQCFKLILLNSYSMYSAYSNLFSWNNHTKRTFLCLLDLGFWATLVVLSGYSALDLTIISGGPWVHSVGCWGSNLGLTTCKAYTLLVVLYLQCPKKALQGVISEYSWVWPRNKKDKRKNISWNTV